MGDRYSIQIDARENATPAFRAIASEARKTDSVLDGMGDGALRVLQQIERNTAEAATGLRDFARASQEADKASVGFNKGAAAAGAATNALIIGVGKLGQSYIDQQRQVAAVGRLYGDQADEVLKFAEAIQDTTTFSNDAARAAALQTASLVQNYGFQADQIENLISLGADYAALYGLELTDATERLTAAMRGEAEAAEALGLTLNDANVARFAAAQGITNYSNGLDEAGRAAVRYAYLIEQSSVVEGYAAELAQSRAGQAAQFVNQLQDVGQAIGGALGPVGEFGSIAANLGPGFIVAGAAAGDFAENARKALKAIDGVQLGGIKLTRILGAAGVAGAVGLAVYAFAQIIDAAGEADRAVAQLGATSAIAATLPGNQDAIAQLTNDINTIFGLKSEIQDQIAAIQAESIDAGYGLFTDSRLGDLSQRLADVDFDRQVDIEFTPILSGDVSQLMDTLKGQVANDLAEIVRYAYVEQGPNAANVLAELDRLNAEFLAGGDATTYATGIAALSGNLEAFGLVSVDATGKITLNVEAINAMTAATVELASAQDMAAASIQNAIDIQDKYGTSQRTTIEAQIDALRAGALLPGVDTAKVYAEIDILQGALDGLTQSREEFAAGLAGTFRSDFFGDLPDVFGQIEEGFDTLVADGVLTAQAAGQISAAFDDIQSSGASALQIVRSLSYSMYGQSDAALDVASSVELATGRLATLNGIAIDTVEQLSGVIQKTADFATEFTVTEFADDGTISRLAVIDDLLNRGLITVQQYNDAQMAGGNIIADNARAQDALLVVQARQLPLLQDQADAVAFYYEQLAQMEPIEAQRALWMQDANNQAQLLNINAAIYSASIGELDRDVVTNLIANAAQADPVLAGTLESLGLISYGANGEIIVNFPDGESLTANVCGLIDAVDDLIQIMLGVPPAVIEAQNAIDELAGTDLGNPADLNPPETPPLPGVTEPGTPLPGDSAAVDAGVVGLPSTGTGSTYTVNIVTNAEEVRGEVGQLGDDFRVLDNQGVEVYVGSDPAAALAAFEEVGDGARIINDTTGIIFLDAVDEASAKIGGVDARRVGLDATTALIALLADRGDADSGIDGITNKRNAIDGTSASVVLKAIDNYSGLINNAKGWDGAILATTFIDTVYRTKSFDGFANGGVVGYADGGILDYAANGLVLVGENGPELASLPGGTLITPSPASQQIAERMVGGGGERHFHVHLNGVNVGMDDFVQQIYEGQRIAEQMERDSLGWS